MNYFEFIFQLFHASWYTIDEKWTIFNWLFNYFVKFKSNCPKIAENELFWMWEGTSSFEGALTLFVVPPSHLPIPPAHIGSSFQGALTLVVVPPSHLPIPRVPIGSSFFPTCSHPSPTAEAAGSYAPLTGGPHYLYLFNIFKIYAQIIHDSRS